MPIINSSYSRHLDAARVAVAMRPAGDVLCAMGATMLHGLTWQGAISSAGPGIPPMQRLAPWLQLRCGTVVGPYMTEAGAIADLREQFAMEVATDLERKAEKAEREAEEARQEEARPQERQVFIDHGFFPVLP